LQFDDVMLKIVGFFGETQCFCEHNVVILNESFLNVFVTICDIIKKSNVYSAFTSVCRSSLKVYVKTFDPSTGCMDLSLRRFSLFP